LEKGVSDVVTRRREEKEAYRLSEANAEGSVVMLPFFRTSYEPCCHWMMAEMQSWCLLSVAGSVGTLGEEKGAEEEKSTEEKEEKAYVAFDSQVTARMRRVSSRVGRARGRRTRTGSELVVAIFGERERVARNVGVNERFIVRNAECLRRGGRTERSASSYEPFEELEGQGLERTLLQQLDSKTVVREMGGRTGPVSTAPVPLDQVPTPSHPL
jgi:hypothetical protein